MARRTKRRSRSRRQRGGNQEEAVAAETDAVEDEPADTHMDGGAKRKK